jgi:hypothetical protein
MQEVARRGGNGEADRGRVHTAPAPGRPAPVVSGPRSPGHVLALQRAAGNGAVLNLLTPAVQRCGDHIEPGCACAAGPDAAAAEAPVVARDGPDASAPPPQSCEQPGTFRVAGSEVLSLDASLKADCPREVSWFLNRHAMFNLLPLLQGMYPLGTFQLLRAKAVRIGGPRLETAIAVVDVKMRGTPITGSDVRGLIDRMGTLPADQRRDMLRYLGKLVVIDVQGFPVDFSYCASSTGKSCVADLKDRIQFTREAIQEYAACIGDKTLRDGDQCKARIIANQKAKGWDVEISAGTTSSGHTSGKPPDLSHCGPIFDYSKNVIHEPHHVKTAERMVPKYGPKGSATHEAAWNDRDNWAKNEVEAHSLELPFLTGVLKAIATLEGKLR